jgi:hypothetical protein
MATQPIAIMPRHLILIPTELERRIIAPHLAGATPELCRIELCGFGMVAAAEKLDVSAFLIYNDKTKVGKVLAQLP